MKHKLFVFLILSTLLACTGPRVYLVRHAEKASLPAGNPDLTIEGQVRAQDLCKAISAKSLGYVYSTNYSRTLQTAKPIAQKAGLTITLYSPDTAASIVQKALRNKKSTLIVGHSNTLLPLLKNLGISPGMKEIKDDDYDNLFVVYRKNGMLHLKEKTYGKPTTAGERSMN